MDKRRGVCHPRSSVWRGASLLVVLWANVAPASNIREREQRSEVAARMRAFLIGQEGPSALTRAHFLGEERLAASLLQPFAEDSDPDVRRRVAEGLADLAVEQTWGTLESLAGDVDVSIRIAAIRGLGRLHTGRSASVLRAHLTDPSSGARQAAARSLGQLHDPRVVPALLRAAKTEGELEVRAEMLEAVGWSGDPRQAKALAPFLNSSSESTRAAAGRALCLLGDLAGLEIARRLLHSSQPSERRDGVAMLEGVPQRLSRPLLRPLLEDPDRSLAAQAARTLYAGGDTEMLTWLVKAEHTAKASDRRAFEDALEQMQVTDEQRQEVLKRVGWK